MAGFDVLIRGGTVLDGTGAEGFPADVGISGGKIAAVGRLDAPAGQVIDAAGMVVTPGFLDIHRHADLAALRPDFGELELRQGLTTVVNGNCGLSAAPFGPRYRREILAYLEPVLGPGEDVPSESMAAYLAALAARPLPLHVGMLAGSGVIRAGAAGFAAGPLEPQQLRAVHRALERALSGGALGVSLGLGYAPDCFYNTEQLIAALAPLEGTDIPLAVHMRDEGTGVDRSVEEMLTVARALRCPVELSHLKAIGRKNWGVKIPRVLELLRRAREEGLAVRYDVYPYTAGSTQLLHVLPPEFLQGGTEAVCRRLRDPAARARLRERLATAEDYNNIAALVGWESIVLSTLRRAEHRDLVGKTVAEAAALRGLSPVDLMCELLADENCAVTMIDFITAEEDVRAILRSEGASVISDSTYPAEGLPHPRLYGNFVRVIEKYVRAEGVLTLPQAVHKMTGAPAEALGLKTKGAIRPGCDADINVFRPEALHEPGTYLAPAQLAQGMDTVLVQGVPAILRGSYLGGGSGQVLRR